VKRVLLEIYKEISDCEQCEWHCIREGKMFCEHPDRLSVIAPIPNRDVPEWCPLPDVRSGY